MLFRGGGDGPELCDTKTGRNVLALFWKLWISYFFPRPPPRLKPKRRSLAESLARDESLPHPTTSQKSTSTQFSRGIKIKKQALK